MHGEELSTREGFYFAAERLGPTNRYFSSNSVLVSLEFPDAEWPDIFAHLEENDSEFPLLINFYKLEIHEDQIQRTCIAFAEYLSKEIKCATICDGTGFGDDDSPYWSIVWVNGNAYLADDSDTTFGDDVKNKPVRLIRKIELKT